MATQRDPKRKMLAKSDKETTVAIGKTKAKAKPALTRARAKKRVRLESGEALAEAQKGLRAAQAEVKHERKARIKAERALAKAQQALAAAGLVAEKRVSFIVRLTVDKHGQPRRTEIEPAESSRKKNFVGLDGERLVAFMNAYISPAIIPERVIPVVPSHVEVVPPAPKPLRPKASLIVSDVRVLRLGEPGFMTLTLAPEEPFVVQAHFQLLGPEAPSLTAHKCSYEMRVYANKVTSGKSMLLTTCSAELIQDVLEYKAPAEVPGLPPGLYRLSTVVTLGPHIMMAGFYGKTIIHVI